MHSLCTPSPSRLTLHPIHEASCILQIHNHTKEEERGYKANACTNGTILGMNIVAYAETNSPQDPQSGVYWEYLQLRTLQVGGEDETQHQEYHTLLHGVR